MAMLKNVDGRLAGWVVAGTLSSVVLAMALAGCQTSQQDSGDFTVLAVTTYHVDPEQLDAFISTVHGDKLQQMGDEVGPMTRGYLLNSMDDPEIVIHLTLMNIQSEEDMAEAQTSATHPLRMEIFEDVKPYLLSPPEGTSYQLVSTMQYKP